jgi:hypothetical protein
MRSVSADDNSPVRPFVAAASGESKRSGSQCLYAVLRKGDLFFDAFLVSDRISQRLEAWNGLTRNVSLHA